MRYGFLVISNLMQCLRNIFQDDEEADEADDVVDEEEEEEEPEEELKVHSKKPAAVEETNEFEDEELECKDCGETFVFTAGEKEFYAEKGFDNKPVR